MDKYIIVRSADIRHLEELVNRKIGEGYQPHGDISITYDTYHANIFLQPMMRTPTPQFTGPR